MARKTLIFSHVTADIYGMAPSCPTIDIRTHQKAFADRVASIRNRDDLIVLVDEVNDWLQKPMIACFVSPDALDGFWTERLKSDPFLVSDPEREALAEEIQAWRFSDHS